MRHTIYILILIVLWGCAHNAKEGAMSESDFVESESAANVDTSFEETVEFGSSQLAQAKLNDLFELIVLKQEHPEFAEDISAQIESLLNSQLRWSDSMAIEKIEQVRPLGPVVRLSDSLQKVRLSYTIVTPSSRFTDSLEATIKAQTVTIDGERLTAHKVTFESLIEQ